MPKPNEKAGYKYDQGRKASQQGHRGFPIQQNYMMGLERNDWKGGYRVPPLKAQGYLTILEQSRGQLQGEPIQDSQCFQIHPFLGHTRNWQSLRTNKHKALTRLFQSSASGIEGRK